MSFRSKKKKKGDRHGGGEAENYRGRDQAAFRDAGTDGERWSGKKKKRKGMYFDSISIRKSSTNKYEEKNYSYVRHEAKRKWSGNISSNAFLPDV